MCYLVVVLCFCLRVIRLSVIMFLLSSHSLFASSITVIRYKAKQNSYGTFPRTLLDLCPEDVECSGCLFDRGIHSCRNELQVLATAHGKTLAGVAYVSRSLAMESGSGVA